MDNQKFQIVETFSSSSVLVYTTYLYQIVYNKNSLIQQLCRISRISGAYCCGVVKLSVLTTIQFLFFFFPFWPDKDHVK